MATNLTFTAKQEAFAVHFVEKGNTTARVVTAMMCAREQKSSP